MNQQLLQRALGACEHLYAIGVYRLAEDLDAMITEYVDTAYHRACALLESEDADPLELDHDAQRQLATVWDRWLVVLETGRGYYSIFDIDDARAFAQHVLQRHGATTTEPPLVLAERAWHAETTHRLRLKEAA